GKAELIEREVARIVVAAVELVERRVEEAREPAGAGRERSAHAVELGEQLRGHEMLADPVEIGDHFVVGERLGRGFGDGRGLVVADGTTDRGCSRSRPGTLRVDRHRPALLEEGERVASRGVVTYALDEG